jgi:hypothetical protein
MVKQRAWTTLQGLGIVIAMVPLTLLGFMQFVAVMLLILGDGRTFFDRPWSDRIGMTVFWVLTASMGGGLVCLLSWRMAKIGFRLVLFNLIVFSSVVLFQSITKFGNDERRTWLCIVLTELCACFYLRHYCVPQRKTGAHEE